MAIVAAYMVARSHPIRIAYHLHRMQAAHEAIWAEPTTATTDGTPLYGTDELFDRHAYHRERLVDLGCYFHAVYEMENLPDDDEEDSIHSALWKLMTTTFPESDQLTLLTKRNVMEVWDLPSRRVQWEAFVKKHNVPDFRERFMTEAED